MAIIEVTQGTQEWHETRRGKLTGSRISRLFGSASTQARLLEELRRERDAGVGGWIAGSDFDSPDLQRGREHEPRAVALFEMLHYPTRPVGFITRDDWPDVGASIDRLVFAHDDREILGALEVKCPRPKGHLAAFVHGMPPAHRHQVYFEAWVTAPLVHGEPRSWFASFCEDVEPTRQIYVEEVRPPAEWIRELERRLELFLPRLEGAPAPEPAGIPRFF